MKQRNIFYKIAKRLYNNITQLYLNCEISKEMHKKMLPFIEFQEE